MECKITKEKMIPFMSFGKMPLANGFLNKKDFNSEFFYEMEVGFSNKISLLQLNEFSNPKKVHDEKYPFYTSSSEYMKVHFNKPLFGKNVFLHSSGMHQKAIIENKETFEVINAETFGIEGGKISIGKLSGSAGIKYFLDKLDISINDQELKKLILVIKKESINIKEFDIKSIKKIISNLKNLNR